ncbi:glutathione peroxidase [Nematocida displodere]|uniref:Glutathione peroxidase n=1 Tax=Nematocida displodere TaxID=1805483 RepID=A0A177EI01_9MICR|nr:glutathione peroxidase [Nematocida displodere]
METNAPSSFDDFADTSITGETIDFSRYRGKVCLAVNTASNCKLAPKNFELLRTLAQKHPNIEALLFPSQINSFIDQEHGGSEETIARLKEERVFATSTVFAKRNANNGVDVLGWLANKARGILGTTSLKWNFTKFLISGNGQKVTRFSPTDTYQEMKATIAEYESEIAQVQPPASP